MLRIETFDSMKIRADDRPRIRFFRPHDPDDAVVLSISRNGRRGTRVAKQLLRLIYGSCGEFSFVYRILLQRPSNQREIVMKLKYACVGGHLEDAEQLKQQIRSEE